LPSNGRAMNDKLVCLSGHEQAAMSG